MPRTDVSIERPSRLSRVVVVLSALAVGFLAVWILTPIVLANLGATNAAVPAAREASSAPREAKDLVLPLPAEPAKPEPAKIDVAKADPPPEPEPAPAAPTAAPEPPVPAFAAASPSALGMSSEPPAQQVAASTIPWPVPGGDIEPAAGPSAVPAASPPPEDFGPVPLPRKRPNPMLASARLGIPLPRPRPDAAPAEVPIADPSDVIFDRMKYE